MKVVDIVWYNLPVYDFFIYISSKAARKHQTLSFFVSGVIDTAHHLSVVSLTPPITKDFGEYESKYETALNHGAAAQMESIDEKNQR
jgi:hypothetical protein